MPTVQESNIALQRRGFAYLFLSVLLTAISFHVTRAAMADNTPLTVSLIQAMTTVAGFLALGWFWRRRKWTVAELDKVGRHELRALVRAKAPLLLPAPLFLALTGWLINTGINLYGAEMTAFLANLTLVFLVLAGWISGEKTRGMEAIAMLAMIAGAFLFSYHGGTIAWGAIGLMSLACAIIAGKQFLVKHLSSHFALPVAMCVVMTLSLPWTLVLLTLTGQGQWPSPRTLVLSVLAGILNSVAGMGLLYRAYHLVGVARGAPFNALRPLVVLLLGMLFGQARLTPWQMAGALMILAGSLDLTRRNTRLPANGALTPRT